MTELFATDWKFPVDVKTGIRTTSADEAGFLKAVAEAVAGAANGETHVEVLLANYLPLVADMCCKYRGYKAEVEQQTVMGAGSLALAYMEGDASGPLSRSSEFPRLPEQVESAKTAGAKWADEKGKILRGDAGRKTRKK